MRFAFLLSALLFAAPASHAADWAELSAKVIEKGARHAIGEGEELRHLDLVNPNDPSVPRQAKFLSIRGYVTGNSFLPVSASGVAEDWTLDAQDHWRVDQWLYIASAETGKLRTVYHRLIRETRDGSVLEIIDLPAPPREQMEDLWAKHLEKF